MVELNQIYDHHDHHDLVTWPENIKNKAYCFKLEPDKADAIQINKTLGCARYIYNHFLALKKSVYEDTKKNVTYTECSKELTALKKELTWLKEPDSISLQQELRHLDTAFANFFQYENSGYPNFKSRHKSEASYTTVMVNGNIKIDGNKIKLPKLGWVKMKMHRKIPAGHIIKSVTVRRLPTMKYHVSILCEYKDSQIDIVPDRDKTLGLDFAMDGLYVDSNDIRGDYPKYLRMSLKKLAQEQRKLSHMIKGSNNYRKQKLKIAKLHQKVKNQRKDYLHKKSRKIAEKHDIVCIEDLNMKDMSNSLNLGKSVHDNGWGTFTGYLMYKLSDRGKYLIKIDKWFPSSKRCSKCGSIKDDLELSDRVYICDTCEQIIDRDENAAINIKREGMNVFYRTKLPITLVNNRGAHGVSSLKLSS